MGAMNSVGIGHFCIFIVFCDDAKIPLGNELPSKGRDEVQIFESNFAPKYILDWRFRQQFH